MPSFGRWVNGFASLMRGKSVRLAAAYRKRVQSHERE